jgi:hypothetical protein
MSSAVDLLDLRIRAIEERLLGRTATRADTGVDANHTIVDQLVRIDERLQELTAGKERFNNCYQKCRQLDKYLDTEYMERMAATDSAKLEQILAFEEQLKDESHCLERVDQLSANIDSDHIRGHQKFQQRLDKIRVISLQRSQESARIEGKTKQLVLSYNQWLEAIKRQLADWDQVVTQLEDKHRNQKSRKSSRKVDDD